MVYCLVPTYHPILALLFTYLSSDRQSVCYCGHLLEDSPDECFREGDSLVSCLGYQLPQVVGVRVNNAGDVAAGQRHDVGWVALWCEV